MPKKTGTNPDGCYSPPHPAGRDAPGEGTGAGKFAVTMHAMSQQGAWIRAGTRRGHADESEDHQGVTAGREGLAVAVQVAGRIPPPASK